MTARALQSNNWMQIKEIDGLENFISTYEEVVSGRINPNEGIIVNLKMLKKLFTFILIITISGLLLWEYKVNLIVWVYQRLLIL